LRSANEPIGGAIDATGGRLEGCQSAAGRREADDKVKLSRLLRKALRGSGAEGGDVLLSRLSGRNVYFARICPLPGAESGSAAVVFISDPDTHGRTDLDAVFAAHRPTPKEASVVKALIEGVTLGEFLIISVFHSQQYATTSNARGATCDVPPDEAKFTAALLRLHHVC
jgi:hypothetical protein